MSSPDFLRQTLEYYRLQRQKRLDDLRTLESLIRQLELELGESPTVMSGNEIAPMGSDAAADRALSNGQKFEVRPDEFYQKSHSEAARMYLTKIGHAVSWEELIDALKKGGCKLTGADPKKTLYISLIRNARDFATPQSGFIGLRSFYGLAARPISRPRGSKKATRKKQGARPRPSDTQKPALKTSPKPSPAKKETSESGKLKLAIRGIMEDRQLRDPNTVHRAVEEKLGRQVNKIGVFGTLRSKKEYEKVGELYRLIG